MASNEEPSIQPDQLRPLCALEDDTRRRLYDHVVAQGEPVTRDQAGAAVGVDRSLAAYHLDKLVDEGLLAASFARPEGRGGPGAGRPAKRYRRTDREFAVSIPPRDYHLLAEVFARAAASDPTGALRDTLNAAAIAMGRELADVAADAPDLIPLLRRLGFEPYDDGGTIRLRNCPFHRLARDHTELVCTMNLSMLSGLVEELELHARPRLDPSAGHCCVAMTPS